MSVVRIDAGPNEAEASAPPKPARRKRVLIVEDDLDLTGILREFFESSTYEVFTVKDGVDGLKMIMAADFDVILCDMMMPNLPGDMFYVAVQRTKPHLCQRFVFMTGYKGDTRLDAFLRKVNGVVVYKPFHVDDLMDRIQEVIDRTGGLAA